MALIPLWTIKLYDVSGRPAAIKLLRVWWSPWKSHSLISQLRKTENSITFHEAATSDNAKPFMLNHEIQIISQTLIHSLNSLLINSYKKRFFFFYSFTNSLHFLSVPPALTENKGGLKEAQNKKDEEERRLLTVMLNQTSDSTAGLSDTVFSCSFPRSSPAPFWFQLSTFPNMREKLTSIILEPDSHAKIECEVDVCVSALKQLSNRESTQR